MEERALAYAENQNVVLQQFLGGGYDGSVFATDRKSAIKVLLQRELYEHERDVYCRLQQLRVTEVAGCAVPELLTFDDELWIVEMSIVSAPYVLDFAGARLNRPQEYPPEILREWRKEKRAQFGSDWKYVPRIVFAFEKLGIYLADLSPRNICLTGYQVPPPR